MQLFAVREAIAYYEQARRLLTERLGQKKETGCWTEGEACAEEALALYRLSQPMNIIFCYQPDLLIGMKRRHLYVPVRLNARLAM